MKNKETNIYSSEKKKCLKVSKKETKCQNTDLLMTYKILTYYRSGDFHINEIARIIGVSCYYVTKTIMRYGRKTLEELIQELGH